MQHSTSAPRCGSINCDDPRYPGALKQIFKPPLEIFVEGDTACLHHGRPVIAIVGARRAAPKSVYLAREIARELAGRGACVVSGLARGVDSAAHVGALESGRQGATIAVLGSALDKIYPRENEELARRIVKSGGAVISQYPPGTPPFPSNFLERNRLVAGLARAVLVIQAAAKSGSLVTARHALDSGRDVLALPGAVDDDSFRGSNTLIKSGAYLVMGMEDIEAIVEGLSPRESAETLHPQTERQREIVSKIRAAGTIHIELLRRQLEDAPDFNRDILELELAGSILRLPGDFVTASPSLR